MGEQQESPPTEYGLRSVERVCTILESLQESLDGLTLREVAEASGLPKASAFRYLRALQGRRFVERDEELGIFRIGSGFVGMQSRRLEFLRERTRPWLEKLRDDLGESANLGALDGDAVIYLEVVESRKGVRLASTIGSRDPIHSTALGKAIASRMDEKKLRALLHRLGLPRRTANTITDIETFFVELRRVEETGFAVDDCENDEDGRCVAVPIDETGLDAAAISISAPMGRLPRQQIDNVARALSEAARQIGGVKSAG